MKEGLIRGNLVEEYMLGNTRIKIYDAAYINRTQEEIDETIRRIEAIVSRALTKQAIEEAREKGEA